VTDVQAVSTNSIAVVEQSNNNQIKEEPDEFMEENKTSS